MNLIEAIKSGKRFRLGKQDEWLDQNEVLPLFDCLSFDAFMSEGWEVEEEDNQSKLIDHARAELRRAGLFDKDCYGGLIGEAVLRLIETHSKEGHSGASSAWVVDIFTKLSNFEALTPITSDPSEWEKISADMLPKNQKELWQNKRQSNLFSKDGGETFYNVDDNNSKMNIIEAVKSGKKFKRKGWNQYFDDEADHWYLIKEEILADDWEVEELKVMITPGQFDKAWDEAVEIGLPNNVRARDIIAKRLGL